MLVSGRKGVAGRSRGLSRQHQRVLSRPCRVLFSRIRGTSIYDIRLCRRTSHALAPLQGISPWSSRMAAEIITAGTMRMDSSRGEDDSRRVASPLHLALFSTPAKEPF